MKITGYTGSSGRFSPLRHTVHDPVGDGGDGLLGHLRPIDLGQVRGDLAVGEPCGGQRDHQVIHAGQAPLPLGHELRLERGLPIPRHLDLHRAGLGQHRLGPLAVAGVLTVAADRVVLAIAEMVIHLALQSGLDDHLGQPAQQPAFARQLQPLSPSPLAQLANQLLIQVYRIVHNISHRCLLLLRSYTVICTAPPAEQPSRNESGRCVRPPGSPKRSWPDGRTSTGPTTPRSIVWARAVRVGRGGA
jgi:hypothetical protein